MSTTRTMPHLSAPVERTITGTAASDTGGSPRRVDTGRYAASSTLSMVCCS